MNGIEWHIYFILPATIYLFFIHTIYLAKKKGKILDTKVNENLRKVHNWHQENNHHKYTKHALLPKSTTYMFCRKKNVIGVYGTPRFLYRFRCVCRLNIVQFHLQTNQQIEIVINATIIMILTIIRAEL